MSGHDLMLDDAAMLALDALEPEQAAQVHAHLATCEECFAEYQRLKAVVALLPLGAVEITPRPELKTRVMTIARPATRGTAPYRLWAPVLAAASFVLAVTFAVLWGNVRTQVAGQNAVIADLTAPAAQHYGVSNGEVVRSGAHLYLAMRLMPAPPAGKVYQAWTLPQGSKRMAPSVTFTPRGGQVLLRLPVDANRISAVAVSVEPAGGSAQPTSKPVFVVILHG